MKDSSKKPADIFEEDFPNLENYYDLRYAIYIPTKGRASIAQTPKILQEENIEFYLVTEPQDYQEYKDIYGDKVLVMEKNNAGMTYVRNWCKEHAISKGEVFHWQLDDNIKHFKIRKDNKNIKFSARNILSYTEHFMSLYDNIDIIGLSHTLYAFAKAKSVDINKQVYSAVLVKNNELRWREDCIEDTDYSLQALWSGECTFLMNRLLIDKETSCKMPGGNTEISHAGDGRLRRSKKLQEFWPGYFKIYKKKEEWRIRPSRIWKLFTQKPKRK
jgi:hypothetical protein